MPKRWSKLQREIYKLLDDSINLQIQCRVYPMDSQRGCTDLPRYWITLGKEIIFDHPKQFLDCKVVDRKYWWGPPFDWETYRIYYPCRTDVEIISDLIREYIDTPRDELLTMEFKNDIWGLSDILRAADRRIGRKRLKEYFKDSQNEAVRKILSARGIR